MSIFKSKKAYCSAVIVAAGSSTRFGSDKLFATLGGMPVLARTLAVFEGSPYINEIIVVTESEKIMAVAKLCEDYGINKARKIVCGGATRLESALSGVSETDPRADLIAVHDGARPLIAPKIIEDAVLTAKKYRAAVPAVPTKDTVKLANKSAVYSTPERAEVFSVQTPQVFMPEIIKGVLTNALVEDLTVYDDAQAVEALGFTVYLSEGSEENIKITTPLDLLLAETILYSRSLSDVQPKEAAK